MTEKARSKKLHTLMELHERHFFKLPISGLICSADIEEQNFQLLIGKNEDGSEIYGILPFEQFSIQNLKLLKENPYNSETDCLGKDGFFSIGKWVTVQITHFEDSKIYLSRKVNQEHFFNSLYCGQIVTCEITSLCKFAIFSDIGNGIVAYCPVQNFSKTRYESLLNCCNIGDKFRAVITNINENGQITVSRIKYDLLYGHSNAISLKPGLNTICRIGMPVPSHSPGFFIEISPSITGIMDVPQDVELLEGMYVSCVLRKIRKRDGRDLYHFGFISIVDTFGL